MFLKLNKFHYKNYISLLKRSCYTRKQKAEKHVLYINVSSCLVPQITGNWFTHNIMHAHDVLTLHVSIEYCLNPRMNISINFPHFFGKTELQLANFSGSLFKFYKMAGKFQHHLTADKASCNINLASWPQAPTASNII